MQNGARAILFVLLGAVLARADVTINAGALPIVLSGYLDAYYADDWADTPFPDRQQTPSGNSPDYSYSRKDALAINHALVDAKFATSQMRGALGLQAGTYVQKNYALENDVAQHVYEAQLGIEPVANSDFWIDAGIFPSHIGLESAISKDNLTLTRSLMADNTPYYETGVQASWTRGRWHYAALALQGWQEIGSKNSNKAIGTEIQFKPTDAIVLNSSTYLGQDPNSKARLRRYFHDFYATWQVAKPWQLALSADVGADERSPRDRSLVGWASAAAFARYEINPRWAAAVRGEAYRDPHGLTIATGTPGNFVGTGASADVEFRPQAHVLLRVEVRTLGTQHAVFVERNGLSDSNTYLTSSLVLSF